MQERTTAIWEQLRLSQISSGTASHAPINAFGAMSQAAQFYLSSSCAIWLCADGFVGTTLWYCFHSAPRWKRSLQTSKVLCLELLPMDECPCWMTIICLLSVHLSNHLLDGRTSPTASLNFWPFRRKTIFPTRVTILWTSTYFSWRRPFEFRHQHPLHLVCPCLAGFLHNPYCHLKLLYR